jgi:HD-GYP domain-containing protein (c-di-GMP phosphodiesterase class II)
LQKQIQKNHETPRIPVESELAQALNQVAALQQQIQKVLQQSDAQVRRLETLTRFSSLLNAELAISAIQQHALEATCELLDCETASLLLVDPKSAQLVWENALGEVGEKLKQTVRLPIDNRSIAGWVAMWGEPLLLNDVESDPRYRKRTAQDTGFRTRTMICIPLVFKSRVVGVLQAINQAEGRFEVEHLRLFESLGHQVAIAIDNSRMMSEIKSSFYGTVEALSEAIEKKDKYTGGHTKRVVYYSQLIAKHLGMSREEIEQVELAGLLHDIGKIGIDDKILRKGAPLDGDEWEVMQQHPELGYDILKRVDSLKDVMAGMRYHHERWDGKGYPLKLQGEEIPLIARIIAVADTYDAMVSTRPYRKGLDPQFAYDEITRYSGTQFDPKVVRAFQAAFAVEKMGRGSGGSRKTAPVADVSP